MDQLLGNLPSWAPSCRSEDFVGRGYVLEKLEESFTTRRDDQPRVALWGPGGVGRIAILACKPKEKN